MTHEETIAKSAQLDALLRSPLEDNMASLIDGTFESDLKKAMQQVARTMDTVKQQLLQEVNGMADDVASNGLAAVQKVKDQRKVARDMFTDILGNEVKSDETAGKSE